MRKIYAASGNLFTDSWSFLLPLEVQNEIHLLSRFFCYSCLVCLLGFWLKMRQLSKSLEIWFRMASCSPCLMCKRVEKLQPNLMASGAAASRLVSLINSFIWCLLLLFFVCLFVFYARLQDLRQWYDLVSGLTNFRDRSFITYQRRAGVLRKGWCIKTLPPSTPHKKVHTKIVPLWQ